ncbi:hypothetical protein C8R43DRAFT_1134333 [Mycena crocata]|nr:hypothetical protein C8R43DRAFT_1134333 [Mycena crocata]
MRDSLLFSILRFPSFLLPSSVHPPPPLFCIFNNHYISPLSPRADVVFLRSGGYAPPPFAPRGSDSIQAASESKRSKRSQTSKSSATSITLASPPPSATAPGFPQSAARFKLAPAPSGQAEEFGAFTHTEEFDGAPGGFRVPPPFEREEEFDGAPGGLDSFDDAPLQREALPSPGLGRSRGFSTSGRRDSAFLAGF